MNECLASGIKGLNKGVIFRKVLLLGVLFFFIFLLSGCDVGKEEERPTAIGATNSYIETAIRDVGFEGYVVSMAPPGMCPGHFDLKPSDVELLSYCQLLLRFDFQNHLDKSLSVLKNQGVVIKSVPSGVGLCVPQSYIGVCREVSYFLTYIDNGRSDFYKSNFTELEERIYSFCRELKERVSRAGLSGFPVVCSLHQKQFCMWLGLDVVSVFPAADRATPASIEECIKSAREGGAKLVIGNLQEQSRLDRVISERLEIPKIVFSNFPSSSEAGGFEKLLEQNVDALLACLLNGNGN